MSEYDWKQSKNISKHPKYFTKLWDSSAPIQFPYETLSLEYRRNIPPLRPILAEIEGGYIFKGSGSMIKLTSIWVLLKIFARLRRARKICIFPFENCGFVSNLVSKDQNFLAASGGQDEPNYVNFLRSFMSRSESDLEMEGGYIFKGGVYFFGILVMSLFHATACSSCPIVLASRCQISDEFRSFWILRGRRESGKKSLVV